MSNIEITKLTVNLPNADIDKLKRMANERNSTITSVIMNAIATEVFLSKKISKGNKILVLEKNRVTKEVVFGR